jgi:phosphoglycerol transferase
MKGRETDAWQNAVAAQPPAKLLRLLCLAGFDGIWLDRFGYPDGGKSLEGSLGQLLSVEPLVSANQRFAFFSLSGFKTKLKDLHTSAEWQARRAEVLAGFRRRSPWDKILARGSPPN